MIILPLIISAMCLSGQPSWHIAKTYSTESGLPNNQVFSIAQDQFGFLWMATADGVSRFDGYNFKNFYSNPNDSTSPAVAQIYQVIVDRANNVWIVGTRSIVQKYSRTGDCFISYDKMLKKALCSEHLAIGLDESGTLVVVGNKGMAAYDETAQTFLIRAYVVTTSRNFRIPDGGGAAMTCENGVFYISNLDGPPGKSGVICMTIDSLSYSVSLLNLKSAFVVNHFPTHQKNDIDNHAPANRFYRSADGNLWLASNSGLYLLDTVSKEFNLYTRRPDNISFLTTDKYIIWWAPGKGLMVYSTEIRMTMPVPETEDAIVTKAFFDKQGTLWFCGRKASSTENIGLIKAIRSNNLFHCFSVPVPREKQQQWAVFALLKDDRKNLWIGVNNLPYLIVAKPDHTFEKVMVVPERLRKTGFSPRAMCFDQEGSLWVGYLHNLLVKLDPDTKTVEQIWEKPLFREDLNFMKSFRRFKPLGNSRIWAGGTFGIACFDLNAQKAYYSYKLDEYAFYDFHFGNKDEFWIANKGTLKYFIEGKWKQDFRLFGDKYDISMIIPGSGDIFWLPLYGGGLCKFNKVTHAYSTFTTENGLANSSVYCALNDGKGNLWLTTNKGISRFNIQTERFWNFNQFDGLTIEEFNGNSSCLASDGEMIFGGVGGYVRFYPDSIRVNSTPGNSHILITEIQVSGVHLHFDSAVYQKKKIILDKGSANLTFHFTCTDLRDAEKIAFRYRLSGHDEEWVITDNKLRFANYVNLVPGEYLFYVQASDITGEWSKEAALRVIIPARFYQTALFKFGIMGIILLLIVSVIWFYIYQLKLTERKKQETVKLELLRSQLNPHFIFNALNPLNYMISSKDVMGANQYLSDFSRLLRLFLTNSRSEFIHIGQEVETIEKYLFIEQARFGKIFDYSIRLAPVLMENMPEIAPAMVQPFLENSILHGFNGKSPENPGHLLILYEPISTNFIRCVIEDDGIGIHTSRKRHMEQRKGHVSHGIQIVRERLELYSTHYGMTQKIVMEEIHPGADEPGTRIIVPIPVNTKQKTNQK